MSTPNTHYGAAAIGAMLSHVRSVFFIGIGGVNMSSLAELTQRRGLSVSGSDRTETALTKKLESEGITVYYSHDARHIEGVDAVVYTVAISSDNPEYMAALSRGIPVISRADYLGYLMTSFVNRIGVSGMHGKSTTTSMFAAAFSEAGTDPTVLCGAVMPGWDSSYVLGKNDYFIFEACEYMDSFLDFNPTVAVILNIELDHVDYFKNVTQIRRSFANFAALTGRDGLAVVNADDDNVRLAMGGFRGNVITFSAAGKTDPDDEDPADFYARNVDMSRGLPSFEIVSHGKLLAKLDLSVPGKHNVMNALAAFATGYAFGLDPSALTRGISAFTGTARRMEYKGKFCGADVYDDYGHHPTEIAATLRGCRDMGYDRVFCIFQPHTYSRTYSLFDEFANALSLADETFLIDIYAAREKETFGVSSEKLAAAAPGNVFYEPSPSSLPAKLSGMLRERDALIVMGAGDIYKLFPLFGFGG